MIFVDTSAWYALEVEDDVNHKLAIQFLRDLREGRYGSLLTTDYVLDEAATLFWIRRGPTPSLAFLDKVKRSKNIHTAWVDSALFWKTVDFMKQRQDKRWSFTDFTSFLVMEQVNVVNAFSFDNNFKEAGFVMLPKSSSS